MLASSDARDMKYASDIPVIGGKRKALNSFHINRFMTSISIVEIARRFKKSDLLYSGMICVFTFLILAQINIITLNSYPLLVAAGVQFESLMMPAVIGTVMAVFLYFILRCRFSQLNTLIIVLLTTTSVIFTTSFAAGSFSAPVAAMHEYIVPIEFNIENLQKFLFLLPVTLLAVVHFALRRNMTALSLSLLAIVLIFFIPIVALPLIAIVSAFGLESIENPSKERDLTFAFLMCAAIMLYFIKSYTIQSIVFAILAGILITAILLVTEKRHRFNIVILLAMLLLSILNGFVSIYSIERIDSETLSALAKVKSLDSNGAIASIYADTIDSIARYETGKNAKFTQAVDFLFSNESAERYGIDWILIDTSILNDAKSYASLVNRTIQFEVFRFITISQVEEGHVAVYTSHDGSMLLIPVNENGQLISEVAFLNGQSISIYRLIALNANDPRYSLYIYPKGDTNLNILKLLFPEQFGAIEGAKEVWSSNSSRMRLYTLTA